MVEIEFSRDAKRIKLTVRTNNKGAIFDFERRLMERFVIVKSYYDRRRTYEFVLELKRGVILKKEQIASVIRLDLGKSGIEQ